MHIPMADLPIQTIYPLSEIKYTIRSTSEEGVYYLVNGWYKHWALWKKQEELTSDMLFKRIRDAKRSLTMLLKFMPDYATDQFEIVAFIPKPYLKAV